MSGRGEPGSARNSRFSEDQASILPRAVNDGQWHSFSGANSSRASAARSSAAPSNSDVIARTFGRGISDGNWHSFAPSRAGFGARPGSGFQNNFRGGAGWGFGRGGWGWGRGCCWGWGWGWGWPYWSFFWGPGWGWGGWAWGWDPWWYNPYWYAPWPMYNPDWYYNGYSGDYGYSDDDVRPPYRPKSDRNGAPNQNPPNQSAPSNPAPPKPSRDNSGNPVIVTPTTQLSST
jgi:hypothetical protein